MLGVFDIHEPASVNEASEMLRHYGSDAAVYAGGTELLLLMKGGLVHYPHLINIKTIPQLNEIRFDEKSLQIGALATHHQLEHDAVIRKHTPLLSEVESNIANLRVRITGTIGGNLCFAEPHSDLATLLLAWGADLELANVEHIRQVPVDEFFVGLFATERQDDEILTGITISHFEDGMVGAYEKFGTHERPTATVAVILQMQDGLIGDARVAIGSVGPVPLRVVDTERMLQNERPSATLLEEAVAQARQAVDAVDDIYGSADYKRHLTGVLVERALRAAVGRAGQEVN